MFSNETVGYFQVETRGKHAIKSVHAGSDGTFMIRTNGRLLACGSNEDNRLGFNSVARGLHKRKQEVWIIQILLNPHCMPPHRHTYPN